MVFKTICVGSIPATLVIVMLNVPGKKNKKALFKTKSIRNRHKQLVIIYKQLRRKFALNNPRNKKTNLTRLREVSRRFTQFYKRSRRIRNIKRRSTKIFRFRGLLKRFENLVKLSTTSHMKVWRAQSISPSNHLISRKAVQLSKKHGLRNLHKYAPVNAKLRKKKASNVNTVYALLRSRNITYPFYKNNALTKKQLPQAVARLRRRKYANTFEKIAGYKKPRTTRSYKLEYAEKFSASFFKNDKLTLFKIQLFENPMYTPTETLLPINSPFAMLNVANFSWCNYQFQLPSVTSKSTSLLKHLNVGNLNYVHQLRNILFSNKAKHVTERIQRNTNSVTENHLILNGGPVVSPRTNQPESNILQNWSLESDFVRRKNLKAPNAVFILGKAPTYRMSKNSESPISTSQQNGNFFNSWSHLNYNHKNTSLFLKPTLLPFILKFNRPKPQTGAGNMSNRLYASLHTSLIEQRESSLRKLTQLRPTNLSALQKTPQSLSKNYSRLVMNMKQVSVPLRRGPRGYNRARSKFLRKQKMLTTGLNLSKRRQLRAKKSLKLSLRRVNRLFRWKAKKATFFYSKCIKLNRSRKKHLKTLYGSAMVSSRASKHGSFNTNINLSERLLPETKSRTPRTGLIGSTLINVITSMSKASSTSHAQTSLFLLTNPLLLKSSVFSMEGPSGYKGMLELSKNSLLYAQSSQIQNSNLVPHESFNKVFSKKVLNSFANRLFRDDIIPLYQNTLIRFIEFCTGKKALFQFYPFVNQHIDKSYMVRYKRWLPRMGFYERRLGHRFFLEESLHIIHISFVLRDPKIIASWLRAMILRISFWKTRSIFRFLKYLFHNYFIHVFDDVKIKGLKIRLKGKISAAGNSRKRTILYRIGKTSHSEVNLRVVKDFSLINTFTGVMGFQVYLFY